MIKKSLTAVSFFIVLFYLTGCQSGPGVSPRDTILGSNFHSHPDWIDEENYLRKEGLVGRAKTTADSGWSDKDIAQYCAHGTPVSSVYFSFDRSSLSSNERAKIKEAKDKFNTEKAKGVLVVGRCDWHGTEEYNLALGDRRARAVQDYLKDLGVQADQIRTLSKGSLEAAHRGSPDECGADRRADLIVMK